MTPAIRKKTMQSEDSIMTPDAKKQSFFCLLFLYVSFILPLSVRRQYNNGITVRLCCQPLSVETVMVPEVQIVRTNLLGKPRRIEKS